jgi:hypothetical protein
MDNPDILIESRVINRHDLIARKRKDSVCAGRNNGINNLVSNAH